jgi:heat shock transcription factor
MTKRSSASNELAIKRLNRTPSLALDTTIAPHMMDAASVQPAALDRYPATMHKAISKNIPAFLSKLYSMVSETHSNHLISWSPDGTSFIVHRQNEFVDKVLPRFFKHQQFSSFVRQLNMYGFHKVPHLHDGTLQSDLGAVDYLEFSNPHFLKDQPDLLVYVTRKKGKDTDLKQEDASSSVRLSSERNLIPSNAFDLSQVLVELSNISKHQVILSEQLRMLQRDNRELWHESIKTRERHDVQQRTIDKILQFLATVFTAGEVKRKTTPKPATSDARMPRANNRVLMLTQGMDKESPFVSAGPGPHDEEDKDDVPLFSTEDDFLNPNTANMPPNINWSTLDFSLLNDLDPTILSVLGLSNDQSQSDVAKMQEVSTPVADAVDTLPVHMTDEAAKWLPLLQPSSSALITNSPGSSALVHLFGWC